MENLNKRILEYENLPLVSFQTIQITFEAQEKSNTSRALALSTITYYRGDLVSRREQWLIVTIFQPIISPLA